MVIARLLNQMCLVNYTSTLTEDTVTFRATSSQFGSELDQRLAGKVIHWEFYKKFKFDHGNKWYIHNPEYIQEIFMEF